MDMGGLSNLHNSGHLYGALVPGLVCVHLGAVTASDPTIPLLGICPKGRIQNSTKNKN